MTETRKESRVPVTLVASYREPTTLQPAEAECQDLSFGGMFVMTPRPSPRGTLIRFDCRSSDPVEGFSGTGRVVWQRNKADPRGPAGMGVRFIRLEPEGRDSLARLVERMKPARSRGRVSSHPPRGRSDPPSTTTSSQPPPLGAPAAGRGGSFGTTQLGLGAMPQTPAMSNLRPATLRGVAASSFPSPPSTTAPGGPPRSPLPPHPFDAATVVTQALRVEAPRSKGPGSDRPAAGNASGSKRAEPSTLRERLERTKRGPGQADEEAITMRPPAPDPVDPQPAPASTAPKNLASTLTGLGSDRPGPRLSSRAPAPGGVEVVRVVSLVPGARNDGSPSTASAASSTPSTLEPQVVLRVAGGGQEPPVEAQSARTTEPGHGVHSPPPPPPPGDTGPVEPEIVSEQPHLKALRRREFSTSSAPVAALPDPDATRKSSRSTLIIVTATGIGAAVLVARLFGSGAPDPAGTPVEQIQAEPAIEAAAQPVPQPQPPSGNQGAATAPTARYVLEIDTEPRGARVSAGQQAITAPARIDLGSISAPIAVSAELAGYRAQSLLVSPSEFTLQGETYVRVLKLVLTAEPGVQTPASKSEPERRRTTSEESARASTRSTRSTSSAAPEAAPSPKVAPAPGAVGPASSTTATDAADPASPASAPESEPAAETALQRATACLSRGDNECVLRELGDSASSKRELELLIETYRSLGRAGEAMPHVKRYLEKFPASPRATEYQRLLGPASAPAP